jgi:hypothetical protein
MRRLLVILFVLAAPLARAAADEVAYTFPGRIAADGPKAKGKLGEFTAEFAFMKTNRFVAWGPGTTWLNVTFTPEQRELVEKLNRGDRFLLRFKVKSVHDNGDLDLALVAITPKAKKS